MKVYKKWNKKIRTSELNRWFSNIWEASSNQKIPGSLRFKYIAQNKIRPPTFNIYHNKNSKVPKVAKRYIINRIREKFGFDILFSSSYRIAKSSEDFLWFRRDTEQGSVNFYISKIKNKNKPNINLIRDSISKKFIPGPIEKTHMSTDQGYIPKSKEFQLTESLKLTETRGIWEVKNQFMAGPFINHMVAHKNNPEELYILEGFVYSPGTTKRDYIFELEAIFKSIKF